MSINEAHEQKAHEEEEHEEEHSDEQHTVEQTEEAEASPAEIITEEDVKAATPQEELEESAESSVEEVKNGDNVEESFDMEKEMEELGIDDNEDMAWFKK